MSSVLNIRNVHKSFAGRKVLDSIDLTLGEGEIFGLIGLNGAGKTTLIKIMLDLMQADEGQVDIFDIASKDLASRSRLTYLPEKFQPSRYLRGVEYLELSLAYYGRSLDLEVAKSLAAALDLDPGVLSARVGSYSKGMGQKLGLLGAFLVNTDLLVLDEPMSGLDPRARIKLKEQLLASREAGKSIFFSSHILSDIEEICSRIGILHNGSLCFVGTPAHFKQQHGGLSLEKAFLHLLEERGQAA
jgi:ABC-2 type transport system ATP-binding protein